MKTIKSLSGDNTGTALPPCPYKHLHHIYEKADMLGFFNEHFVISGTLLKKVNISYEHSLAAFSDNSVAGHSFTLSLVTASDVLKDFKLLDTRKSAGPNNLEP